MQRYNQRLIEELKNKQTQERARLPKIQRSEAKTRMAMFKKSLRINSLASPDQDREKIKQVINKTSFNSVNVWCDANMRMGWSALSASSQPVQSWVDALDEVKASHPSPLHWWDSSGVLRSSPGLPSTWQTWIYWSGSHKGPSDEWGTGGSCYRSRHLGYLWCVSLRRAGSRASYPWV